MELKRSVNESIDRKLIGNYFDDLFIYLFFSENADNSLLPAS